MVRTKQEAVKFYFAHILLILLVGFICFIFSDAPSYSSANDPEQLGEDFADEILDGKLYVFVCLFFSFLIVFKKNYQNDLKVIIIALFSGVVAYFNGPFIGMIITSYLTTFEINYFPSKIKFF